MSLVVRAGKAGKKFLKEHILPPEIPHIRYTRRIERVKTARRICAMTFDDGPMDLPAVPDQFHGESLTDVILDILARFNAKGTFDVIGDTSANYPDKAGKIGSPSWGGIQFDHYPDILQDEHGGAEHNDRLIRRILDEGHQITNHGYRHILFGKKNVVYGKRVYYPTVSRVEADLRRLDNLLREEYDYEITMGRPPHYVDQIRGGFTSYDVYDRLGYLYLGASYDGGGWLPSNLEGDAAVESEVAAMTEPMRQELRRDPDFFCGQIIFQKDGYNMAKRTPVALGLPIQLELLQQYGYQVVTVEELLEESPFADVGREDPLFDKLAALSLRRAVAYSDNYLRLEQEMTVGELAMLLAPREEAVNRRWMMMRRSGREEDTACGAISWCVENHLLPKDAQADAPVTSLPEELFDPVKEYTRRAVYDAFLKSVAAWSEDDEDDEEEYDDEEESGTVKRLEAGKPEEEALKKTNVEGTEAPEEGEEAEEEGTEEAQEAEEEPEEAFEVKGETPDFMI